MASWRGSEPFLLLIEGEHHGAIARSSNLMVRRARYSILVRFDGDTEMRTVNWAVKLAEAVGGWQLLPDHKLQDPESPTRLLDRQQPSAAVAAAPNHQG